MINCRSLKGKVAIFLASLNYYQPDCILGTESWLDKDTTTSEIFPPEYQVLRKDRNSKARGGGVFIAVRKHYDMDFSKAFDVVPHQRLLHKLDHYGIRGTTLNWIHNFLTNRTQKVVVDGSSSESARVRSGVPLLFLTYINDLPSTVSSQVRLLADDCLLYRPIKCRADQEQLQRDLSALQDWADRWGMCFNPSKCSVLRVSRPK